MGDGVQGGRCAQLGVFRRNDDEAIRQLRGSTLGWTAKPPRRADGPERRRSAWQLNPSLCLGSFPVPHSSSSSSFSASGGGLYPLPHGPLPLRLLLLPRLIW